MIYTDGPMLRAPQPITETEVDRATSLLTTFKDTVMEGPIGQPYRVAELGAAKAGMSLQEMVERGQTLEGLSELLAGPKPSIPKLPIADARQRIKDAGLEKEMPLREDADIPEAAFEIMFGRARERHERKMTIARGPSGIVDTPLWVGTQFLASAVDPLNIAASFVPVVGPARYARLLASAGEGALARTGARAAAGAAEGAAGVAMLQPLEWYARTQEGQDYGLNDMLTNLVFGAGIGAVFHSGGGAVADFRRTRKGNALYPFGPGEPADRSAPLSADPLPISAPRVDGEIGSTASENIRDNGSPASAPPLDLAPASLSAAAAQDRPALLQIASDAIDGLRIKLRDMFTRAVQGPPAEAGKLELGPVTAEGAARINAVLQRAGIDADVTGYRHEVDAYATRHAVKQHADPDREVPRGQSAITAEDWAMIPDVLATPDRVDYAGRTGVGREGISVLKRINGHMLVIEEVRTGRQTLAVTSVWKYKIDGGDGAPGRPNAPDGTPSPDVRDALPGAEDIGASKPGVESASAALQDLPPEVQRDALRATIANLRAGEPVRAAEMLNAAAQANPRIEESMSLFRPRETQAEGPKAGRDFFDDFARLREPFEEPEARAALQEIDVLQPRSIDMRASAKAALDQDAVAAEMYQARLADIPEPQQNRVKDALRTIDDELKAHEAMLKQGAACLAAALG
jgi:hypothetical protein